MSEKPIPAQSPVPADGSPQPEPLRWFGVSWAARGGEYWARRVAVAVGALVALVAGGLLMRLGVQGVFLAGSGTIVDVLLVLAVAICSLAAAARTWRLLSVGKDALTGWMADEGQLRVMLVIGFVGSLAAYFVRSLFEAPGEGAARARWDAAKTRATLARTRPKGGGAKRRKARR
ncbi:hypothetical protein [Phaeacidiphilus oryzae]|uniref:hypothetical protein n=1 Tax=Phaeacidiphilus oryzae TaxID=348818 RepID=UPI00056D13F3|nr:hypothetical protein [Phaeacidiphilus oryzae]